MSVRRGNALPSPFAANRQSQGQFSWTGDVEPPLGPPAVELSTPSSQPTEVFSQKHAGAYFTPAAVAGALVHWAVRSADDRLLDPSCGDGQFLVHHPNSFGVERDEASAGAAAQRAPRSTVVGSDFFAWAEQTSDRFDCAAGNPPFIRYQTFTGAIREQALARCRQQGVDFSGLASSWAPFLVTAASLLKPGGRLAFVVPAEIGHAPYAVPLLEYLVDHFSLVQVVAVRTKLFPELSEDCWLLYAEGRGGRASSLRFSKVERFDPDTMSSPPRDGEDVSTSQWRSRWNRRLRPLLMSAEARACYRAIAEHPRSSRFGAAAAIGIGYVSGANEFFHLRPSQAERRRIPEALLTPSVRNGRSLPTTDLTPRTVRCWRAADVPMLLLRLPKERPAELPAGVRRYLDSAEGEAARLAYKCRVRDPWYSVPDVQTPDYFLSYMSGAAARLVRNAARVTGTNSVLGVRVGDAAVMQKVVSQWTSQFAVLSREIEGHPLGGGMLKLEPREARQILFPADELLPSLDAEIISEAVATMQRWRHHVGR